MVAIRQELLFAKISRAYTLTDYNSLDDFTKRHEFRKQTILADNYLTKDEQSEAIQLLNKDYDYNKILYDDRGKMRVCEDGNHECLATLYCERCVQNYLMAKFSC